MPRKRLSHEEQYRLVMECRQSGLSDYQWCLQNDIKPSTFYTWIQRLKKRGVCDIPDSVGRNSYSPAPKQEVVRIDFSAPCPSTSGYVDTVSCSATEMPEQASVLRPTLELNVSGINLKVTNEVNPTLLMQTLQMLKGFSC